MSSYLFWPAQFSYINNVKIFVNNPFLSILEMSDWTQHDLEVYASELTAYHFLFEPSLLTNIKDGQGRLALQG